MANDNTTYQLMGSILARLAFDTSIKTPRRGTLTPEEEDSLHHFLQVALAALIRTKQHFELDDAALEACADGFAFSLTHMIVDVGRAHEPPMQTMPVDDGIWELVFDPGPDTAKYRVDDNGRVWRENPLRVGRVLPDDDPLPF